MTPQEWTSYANLIDAQLENTAFLREGATHLAAALTEIDQLRADARNRPLAERVAESVADDVQAMQVRVEALTAERDAYLEEVRLTNENEHRIMSELVSTRGERDQLRAEVERLKAESTVAAVSVLVDHARGVLQHLYEGACPDSVEGPDARDPECPVCRAIDSASRLRTIGPGEVVVSREHNEREARAEIGPGHDPTGEGSARQGEGTAKSAGPVVPAGWVQGDFGLHPPDGKPFFRNDMMLFWITPDPSIPWGEGFEALLPEEAETGDEYWTGSDWVAPLDPSAWSAGARRAEVWRRRIRPLPGSGPQLREAVQAIQGRAENAATPEPWNEESSKGILALVNERDRLRAQVSRLQDERDSAVGRAVPSGAVS